MAKFVSEATKASIKKNLKISVKDAYGKLCLSVAAVCRVLTPAIKLLSISLAVLVGIKAGMAMFKSEREMPKDFKESYKYHGWKVVSKFAEGSGNVLASETRYYLVLNTKGKGVTIESTPDLYFSFEKGQVIDTAKIGDYTTVQQPIVKTVKK